MTAFGDPTAPVSPVEPWPVERYPHVYVGEPRGAMTRACRLIIPGRVGSDRRRIELDDGTELVVALKSVLLMTPCQACGFTGKVTRIVEPKEPAVTSRCQRCRGLGRHLVAGQPERKLPAPPAPPRDPEVDRQRIERSFAKVSSRSDGRRNLTGPGEWARERRGRSDW